MAPVFIFARQIQEIIRSGKKEIEIPDGARISAAAADLIKANKIKVLSAPPRAAAATEAPPTHPAPEPEKSEVRRDDRQISETEAEQIAQPAQPEEAITEDVVEDIVNRVLARFSEIKGPLPRAASTKLPAAETSTAPAPEPADDDDLVICRCEEITKGEIKDAIRNGMHTLNGIKRITRAGMGLCQGQTCQQLVARILTEELGLAAADIDPTTARGPVRPLRLEVFANS